MIYQIVEIVPLRLNCNGYFAKSLVLLILYQKFEVIWRRLRQNGMSLILSKEIQFAKRVISYLTRITKYIEGAHQKSKTLKTEKTGCYIIYLSKIQCYIYP